MGATLVSANERSSATRPTPAWRCATGCSPAHGSGGEPVLSGPVSSHAELSENPSGALGVYERAGFKVESRWTNYFLMVSPSPP